MANEMISNFFFSKARAKVKKKIKAPIFFDWKYAQFFRRSKGSSSYFSSLKIFPQVKVLSGSDTRTTTVPNNLFEHAMPVISY